MYKMLFLIMKGRYSWGKGVKGICNFLLLFLGESVFCIKKILFLFWFFFNVWVYLIFGFE